MSRLILLVASLATIVLVYVAALTASSTHPAAALVAIGVAVGLLVAALSVIAWSAWHRGRSFAREVHHDTL